MGPSGEQLAETAQIIQNTEDSTAEISFPDIATEDGSELLVWEVLLPNEDMSTKIRPGNSLSLSWDEIVSGWQGSTSEDGATTTYSLTAMAFFSTVVISAENYTSDGTFYPTNEDALTASIIHNEDGETFTISVPSVEPLMTGYQFVEWECNGYTAKLGDTRFTMVVEGETEGESTIEELFFSYDMASKLPNITITAAYTDVVALRYFNSLADYNSNTLLTVINQVQTAGASEPLSITPDISQLVTPAGGTFLAWYYPRLQSYTLQDEAISLTWDALLSGNVYPVAATWLTTTYMNDTNTVLDDFSSVSTEVNIAGTVEDGYMIVAPKEVPELTGYFFKNWTVAVGSDTTEYYAEPERTVATVADQTAAVFPFSGDTNVTFTANWTPAATANIVFYFGAGEFAAEDGKIYSEKYTHTVTQATEEQTTYSITMPSGTPTRDGYTFAGWEYVTEAETFVFAANETPDLTWNFGEVEVPPIFTAKWLIETTIEYVDPSGIPLQPSITVTQQDGEENFDLKFPAKGVANTAPAGAQFLIWGDYWGSISESTGFYLPEETVTVNWAALEANTADSYDNKNNIRIISYWLNTVVEHGDIAIGDWSGTASIENRSKNGFTVRAPKAPTVQGQVFTGWTINGGDIWYNAASEGIFMSEDGSEEMVFDYGAYNTMTIQSNWQDASVAQVTFNANGGTYTGTAQTIYQTEVGQTDFEVTLPTEAEVTRTGYILNGWKYTNEAGETQIFEAGEAATATLPFGVEGSTVEYELLAVWIKSAVINYVLVPDGEAVQTETIDGEEADTSFTVTLSADIPSGVEESTFLAWYSTLGTPEYGLPGDTMTFAWTDVINQNNIVSLEAQRLTVNYEGVETADWSGEATVTPGETSFTLSAPETAPEEAGRFFLGWNVAVGDRIFENIGAGMQVGNTLDYATYANQTVTFTSQWQAAESAEITFNMNGGTYNGSTASEIQTVTQAYADETEYVVTMLKAPARTGYTFAGWEPTVGDTVYNLKAETTTEENNLILTYADNAAVEFIARWSISADVNYYAVADGDSMGTESVEGTGTDTSFVVTLEESGIVTETEERTFLAWYSNLGTPQYGQPGAAMTFNWADVVAANNAVQITAKWLEVRYSAIETADWSGEATVTPGETSFTLSAPETAPEEAGRFFLGWTVNVGGQSFDGVQAGERVGSEFAYTGYADTAVTFTAQWVEQGTAEAIFNMNGGTYNNSTANVTNTITQSEESEAEYSVTMLTAPVRTGYTFEGWRITLGGTSYTLEAGAATDEKDIVLTYESNPAVEFTAQWSVSATVKYQAIADGDAVKTEIFTGTGAETTFAVILEEAGIATGGEGSTFLGWYSNIGEPAYGLPGSEMTFTWADVIANNNEVTIEALWTEFVYDGVETAEWSGEASLSTDGTIVTVYAPESTPAEDEKFFLGWNVAIGEEVFEGIEAGAQVGNGFDYTSVANKAITFTARWKEQATATITFDLDGGILGDSMENVVQTMVQTGADAVNYVVTMLAAPLKEGYNFDGWVTTVRNVLYTFAAGESTEGSDLTLNYNEDTDVTFTAQWVSVTPTPPSILGSSFNTHDSHIY